jgi:hypothetical protein
MNIINSEELDLIQLLTDDEAKTLILALVEGAGGLMKAEELDAAMETTFEWAQKVRLESTVLECILRGNLLVRCEPDGEIAFMPKKQEFAEPFEEDDRSTPGPNREFTLVSDCTASPSEPFLGSPDPTDGEDTIQ